MVSLPKGTHFHFTQERDCQRAVDAELDRRRHEIYMRQFIKDAEEESDRRLAELKEELGIQADLAQEDEEDQDPSQAVLQVCAPNPIGGIPSGLRCTLLPPAAPPPPSVAQTTN